jgi:hypothetical protein
MDRRRSTADDNGRIRPTSKNQLIRKAPARRREAADERATTDYVAGGDGTRPVHVPDAADGDPD